MSVFFRKSSFSFKTNQRLRTESTEQKSPSAPATGKSIFALGVYICTTGGALMEESTEDLSDESLLEESLQKESTTTLMEESASALLVESLLESTEDLLEESQFSEIEDICDQCQSEAHVFCKHCSNSYCTACSIQRHRIGKRREYFITRLSRLITKIARVSGRRYYFSAQRYLSLCPCSPLICHVSVIVWRSHPLKLVSVKPPTTTTPLSPPM